MVLLGAPRPTALCWEKPGSGTERGGVRGLGAHAAGSEEAGGISECRTRQGWGQQPKPVRDAEPGPMRLQNCIFINHLLEFSL